MSDEDFDDFEELSDEEELDDPVLTDQITHIEPKPVVMVNTTSEANKRRRLEDLLEARRLRKDLDEYDGEIGDRDSYYENIMKELYDDE